MLKRLYIDNYKTFVNFDVAFEEMTLLLGREGVGKTALLEVLFEIRELLSRDASVGARSKFSPATCHRWSMPATVGSAESVQTQTFEVEVCIDGDQLVYRLEVEHSDAPGGSPRSRIVLEQLTGNGGILFRFHEGLVTLYDDRHAESTSFKVHWSESALARVVEDQTNLRLVKFRNFLARFIFCAPYPGSISSLAKAEAEVIDWDGSNFAGWFWRQQASKLRNATELISELGQVIDGFWSVGMEDAGLGSKVMRVEFRDEATEKKEAFALHELADGQRMLLLLYSLVFLAPDDGVVIVDGPENFVALREIQPWLFMLGDFLGDRISQVILASHHPETIDLLAKNHGVLLYRDGTSHTKKKQKPFSNSSDTGLELAEIVARGWEA